MLEGYPKERYSIKQPRPKQNVDEKGWVQEEKEKEKDLHTINI
jgi:hypothetical protein